MNRVSKYDCSIRYLISRWSCDQAFNRIASLPLRDCRRIDKIETSTAPRVRYMMWNKPFKPPLLKQVPKPALKDDSFEPLSPPRPAKKRRFIHVISDSPPPSRPLSRNSPAIDAPRKPLLTVTNPVAAAQSAAPSSEGPEGYYLILWYFILSRLVAINK